MLLDETEPLDSRILRLAQNGQRKEACRLLVEAYGSEIIGTCISRMGSPAAGEDAAQDTMARALVALENYRGTAGLRPWLHRIASNRCIDLLRSRRSRLIRVADQVEIDHVPAPERPLPVEVAESQAAQGRVLSAVRAALSVIKEPDRTWVFCTTPKGSRLRRNRRGSRDLSGRGEASESDAVARPRRARRRRGGHPMKRTSEARTEAPADVLSIACALLDRCSRARRHLDARAQARLSTLRRDGC
ncbi:MAG: RNA polymerase sigma factor [Myxococcota bacterium]